MPTTIIQYETRDDPNLNALMARNKSYCVKNHIQYIRFGPLQDLPAYWIKVNLVLMVLRGAADGDIVGWLDSDAVIVDEQTPIADLFREASSLGEGGKFFLGSRDPKPWPAPFNAGVFFVKANGVSRRLMEDWMDMYKPDRWAKLADGSWKCLGVWAGEDYEQGAFCKYILPKYAHAIKIYHGDKFDCTTPAFADLRPNGGRVFSCHFAGAYKIRIRDFIANNGRGTGEVRPVDLKDSSDLFFTDRNIALVVVGALAGTVAIWAFTKKETRSPAAALVTSVIDSIKKMSHSVI
jgi:hypothetical protein